MKIKGIATTIDHPITLLWVPSHCDLEGNEKADELANQGSKLCQVGIPVSHEIVKARIKRRKWSITHERAKVTYGDRRSPRFDVEKQWPRSERRLFARLGTGHAKELKRYAYLIDSEDDPTCICGEAEESIQHVLCECESLARERALHAASPVTIMDMTLEPEMCRKILQSRFPGLRITNTPNTHNAEVHEVVGGTELPHGILGVAFA